jgi:hypothetical protein
MEAKLKYLEFIQNIITRMNTNSFIIKGWTVTLVSALFALAAKDINIKFAFISYLALPLFWLIDGFFLSQERLYRSLYEKVRSLDNEAVDFNMKIKEFNLGKNTWCRSLFSTTLVIFYGLLMVIICSVCFLLRC